jgi:AcrR family transcriptional regulator
MEHDRGRDSQRSGDEQDAAAWRPHGGRAQPRRRPGQAGRPSRPHHSGPGARDPAWEQWQGDPDDLWPTSIGASSSPGEQRADRQDPQRPQRRRDAGQRRPDRIRPRLTRDEIVDAAIAIADAEGAEALSMRRIAQVLRSGTMSLYWHVSSKEHLLDLMRDMLMAEIEVPKPSGDWRADLREIAVSSRTMLRRHHWLMDFIGGRPPLGPNTVLSLERSLATLTALRLTPAATFDIFTAVNTYVVGVVLREAQEIRTQQAEAESGIDVDQARSDRNAWRDRLASTGLFPNFVELLDANVDPDALETMEDRFEFGLECLLDGIAARISSR